MFHRADSRAALRRPLRTRIGGVPGRWRSIGNRPSHAGAVSERTSWRFWRRAFGEFRLMPASVPCAASAVGARPRRHGAPTPASGEIRPLLDAEIGGTSPPKPRRLQRGRFPIGLQRPGTPPNRGDTCRQWPSRAGTRIRAMKTWGRPYVSLGGGACRPATAISDANLPDSAEFRAAGGR